VAKLSKAVNEVLKGPEAQSHFAKINLHAAGGTPAEAAAFIKKETEVWGGVIKDAHVEAH
jgi:tripartite-type tricarboxylate transporter receptor subunit TctC